jgi:hypothetical protein
LTVSPIVNRTSVSCDSLTRIPAVRLIRTLHPQGAGRQPLLVIKLFADVSGKDAGLARVAAGYLATEQQWEAFEQEWGLALRLARVSHVHATDFFNFQKQFKGWDGDLKKHAKFSKRFTAIAANQTAAGLALGVDLAAFHRILAPIFDKHPPSKSGRYTSLMFCAFNLLFEAAKLQRPPGERIAVLFEEEEGIGGVIDYYNYRRKKDEDWTRVFASVGVGAKKEFLPLQAADLLAHESWRRVCDYLQPTGRPKRKSFQRLLEQDYVDIRLTSEADIVRAAPNIERYLQSL